MLLEELAALPHAPTLVELAGRLALPKATVHRWLGTLEDAGLLRRLPDGRRYELAGRAHRLALAILSNGPGGALRHGILQGLAEELGEACNLTVLDGTEVTYLDRAESRWPLRITFQQGSKVPAHCSASGKLFLALMPPARRAALLQQLPLARHTAHTLTDADALAKECIAIRRAGHALDREEFLDGLVCLAVPVWQGEGRSKRCVAALAIQAPVTRLSCDDLVARLPRLQAAATAMAATLAG
jgi:DNA-binding IclR family transcriptional regulator